MQRRFRLHRSKDIQRVRRTGKSYAHPLLVLITLCNGETLRRVAVTANRSVGKAVERNRARRRIRAAVRPFLVVIPEGWDCLLVARPGVIAARYDDLTDAVRSLFQRAGLLDGKDGTLDRGGG